MKRSEDYKQGYSAGYQAGKLSSSNLNSDKQESYNVIVNGIAKMYLDGGWGTKTEGKHVKYTPAECYEQAVIHANNIIKTVRIS
jgi:hypothetical protein